MRLRLVAGLLALPAVAAGGPLRVTLVNGTTGGPGTADLLTLYRLGEGMEPVASVEGPEGEAVLEAPDEPAGAGTRPFLLQATYRGVNYNQTLRLAPGAAAEATVTVHDTFSEWREPDIALATWRALYRRLPPEAGAALRVDHIFIVRNATDPPRTFASEDETLRFRLPPEPTLRDLPTVNATGGSGMPVPQSPFPVGEDGDYAIRTAFKPGETEIVLSYEVAYPGERHRAALRAPRASPEVLLFASPSDISLEIPAGAPAGWEILGPDESADLTAARKFEVAGGEEVAMVFSGGSVPRPAAGSLGGRPLPGLVAESEGEGGATGTVGLLPDPARSSQWVIALLMAAALGFGLLHRALGGGGGSGG